MVNPEYEINRNYKERFRKKANLLNPRNLIEKIYWMQLHCDTSEWTICADKYRMREFVASRGCDSYLPKLLGTWNNPIDIDWDSLPNSFVLKANNGCGTVCVVKNKSELSPKKIIRMLKNWMSIPYGYRAFQPHYLRIKPCILAEEIIYQDLDMKKQSSSLVDFKVFAFNGKPESVLVAYDRSKDHLVVDLYDKNWNRLENCIQSHGLDQIDLSKSFSKPICLHEMLEIASILSKGFPEMRVDFYIGNGRPIIGELTMSTGYGYFTEEYYNYLGELTDLSIAKRLK